MAPDTAAPAAAIAANIATVRDRIQHACRKCGRNVTEVTVMAVSKTRPAGDIATAHATGGLLHFGENYAQEALPKLDALASLPLVWHFIGPLQSNKTRLVAERFQWLHSLDRLKVAERLDAQRPSALPPLNVCIEVNVDDEAGKAGLPLAAVPGFLGQLAGLDRLAVRGLMVIPKAGQPAAATLASFRRATECLHGLQRQYPGLPLDTLSMGMSGDLELAIEAGSTMVRIGTDIFGPRV